MVIVTRTISSFENGGHELLNPAEGKVLTALRVLGKYDSGTILFENGNPVTKQLGKRKLDEKQQAVVHRLHRYVPLACFVASFGMDDRGHSLLLATGGANHGLGGKLTVSRAVGGRHTAAALTLDRHL